MQEHLQSRIAGALGQLSQATHILNETSTAKVDHSNQIEHLLDDIIRQQNEIARSHEHWTELNGELSGTLQLGITDDVSLVAASRCVHRQARMHALF